MTSAVKPTAVIPSAARSAASVPSFPRLREISATLKPCRPKERAMAIPRPGPAPTIAMVGMYYFLLSSYGCCRV